MMEYSKQRILITPEKLEGERKDYPIDKINFLNIIPKNQIKAPRPYLIIGLDTEN